MEGRGVPSEESFDRGICHSDGSLLSEGVSESMALWEGRPAVNRMTDHGENITLPATSFAGGNYVKYLTCAPVSIRPRPRKLPANTDEVTSVCLPSASV